MNLEPPHKFALVAEHHPAYAQSFGTPNLIKTLCSSPNHPFSVIVATDLAGPNPVAGPWDDIPTLSLFRPRSLLPKVGLGLLDNFFFGLQRQRVLRFFEEHGIERLFILLSNNPRFALFAANLPNSIPKDIYLVDDFIEDSHIYRVKKEAAQGAMDKLVTESERVFTISPVAATDLERDYGRPGEFLPIPIPDSNLNAIPQTIIPSVSSNGPIVIHYAGTIHHLYAKAMANFIDLLRKLADKKRLDIILEIWGNMTLKGLEKNLEMNLQEQNSYLRVKICGNIAPVDLIKEQKRADFLLLVNSFAPALKKQSRWSFSSKTIEYLVSNTPIILYAPPHSSLVAHLDQYRAAHIICTEETNLALQQIEQILVDPARNKTVASAQNLAKTKHSSKAFFDKVMNPLPSIPTRQNTLKL